MAQFASEHLGRSLSFCWLDMEDENGPSRMLVDGLVAGLLADVRRFSLFTKLKI